MATLEELIRRRKAELDLSFRELGQRAVEAGAKGPNWAHLANKRITEFPKVRTINALATALEVTPAEIVLAAGESLGWPPAEIMRAAAAALGVEVKCLEWPPESGQQWLVVSAEDLSPEDEAIIRTGLADATGETTDEVRGRDTTS